MPSVTEVMTKPAREICFSDFETLISLEAPESDTLELKADLSIQKDVQGWRAKRELHKQETRSLAKEIVALSNTYGGRIFVGIVESKDMPKRAFTLGVPLPNIHDLVERLRDSLSALIEPPIPALAIVPIVVNSAASEGFFVIDVPRSQASPHGYGSPPECYWRRDSSSRPMSIADLHNSFWEARTRRERIDGEISAAETRLARMAESTTDTFAFRISIISEEVLEIRDLVRGLRSGDVYTNLEHSYLGIVTHPMYAMHDWQFSFFGATKTENTFEPRGRAVWTIDETGVVELTGYFFPAEPTTEIILDIEAICGSTAHALRLAAAVGRYSKGARPERWVVSVEFCNQYRKVSVKDPVSFKTTAPVPFRGNAKLRPLIFDFSQSPDTTFETLEEKIWAAFGQPTVTARRYKAALG
ncbi:MAG: ATP-binding protein [Rhizobium sp.]|nr:ATP-binding protein [Rhizobium sp.]MDM8015818.1 ATP-binding protein [Rhizobium sp.]